METPEILLKPLEVKYPHFKKDHCIKYKKGYHVTPNMAIRFAKRDLNFKVPNYKSKCGLFSFVNTRRYLTLYVKESFWFDGATYAIDFKTRMLFALAHDCACLASQDTNDPCFERMFDDIAYEIIRKQGGFRFNAWIVERAVKKWKSTNVS